MSGVDLFGNVSAVVSCDWMIWNRYPAAARPKQAIVIDALATSHRRFAA